MEEYLEGLNEAQQEAVTATEGVIRVIAGRDPGKPGRFPPGSRFWSMRSEFCREISSA